MAEDFLADVRAIKQDALALRNRGKFDDALNRLRDAFARLDEKVVQCQGDARSLARIEAERADTWGMRGGVNRRRGRADLALEDYQQGLALERRDPDRASSYNLGNVIALRILTGTAIDDPGLQADIKEAVTTLRPHTEGSRSDEWWAWADLAQFLLLSSDGIGEARAAYQRGLDTGPKASEVKRHLDILREMMDKVEPTPGPRSAVIDWLAGQAAA